MKRVIGRKSSMAPPASFIQVEKKDVQNVTFKELERIFSAGSSIDAMKIFYTAKDGIVSSTQAIKDLGLTQKRYYTNLKRLIDIGLVEKVDGKYVHTTFGKIAYRLVEVFRNVLNQKDKLDLIDRLLKTKNLSTEEIEEIMRAILKDANFIPGGEITDILGPVKMVEAWESVVKEVIDYINKANEEILFACSYPDIRIMEACLIAAQRGVEVQYLVDRELKISSLARIFLSSLLIENDVLSEFFDLLRSPTFRVRHTSLPYSFLIVDREHSMIEVPTPISKRFILAFLFHNKKVSERLKGSFEELWNKGSDVNILRQMDKGDYEPLGS
jgi:DNA-binding MarR family transcriptional regulator